MDTVWRWLLIQMDGSDTFDLNLYSLDWMIIQKIAYEDENNSRI